MTEILVAYLDSNVTIYRKKYEKKYVSKIMYDNLRNSMTKNRFLQQDQKIELINWEWFGILNAAQAKVPPKMYCYDNILPSHYLSYVSFC